MSESDLTTSQSHTEEEDDDEDNDDSKRVSTDGDGGGDSSSSSSSGSSSGDDDEEDDDEGEEDDDEDEYDVDVGGVEGEVEVVAGGSASLGVAHGEDDDDDSDDEDDDEARLNFSIPSSGAAKEYQLIVERCEALHQDNERLARRITDVKGLVRKADRMRKFLMKRLDSHKDNYRNVPIVMPPEEDDASIRIAQRRKRRGDYDGVDDRGPRKRGRKPKKKEPAKPVGRPRKQRAQGAQEREAGKPKRPQNPFFQFCQDQRKKVAAEYLQERSEELSKKELTKVLAERWRALPTEERKIYNILFEQEKIRYTEEMEKFRSEKQVSLLKQMQEQDMMVLQHSTPQDQHHLPENPQQHYPPTLHFPE